MILEFHNIPRIRSRIHRSGHGLNYLFERVNRDLGQRIGDLGRPFESILEVGFSHGVPVPQQSDTKLSVSAYDYFACPQTFFDNYLPGQFDCVIFNLFPSWGEFGELLSQGIKMVMPGGVFVFSSFGPDTLSEVDDAWATIDTAPHVHPLVDMHHLGDALLRAGLERPIVDAEWIKVNYPDFETLGRDLRHCGFTNVHPERRRSLTGRHRFLEFQSYLKERCGSKDGLGVTFEIIFGLGIVGLSGSGEGRVTVLPPQL